MIKTLLRLAVVALLANAAWQLFTVYWAHLKFTDAVETTTHYRGDKSDAELRARILELAEQFDIPISDENLTMQLVDRHTLVDASYTQPVRFVPGFVYPWPFTVHTDTTVEPGAAELSLPK